MLSVFDAVRRSSSEQRHAVVLRHLALTTSRVTEKDSTLILLKDVSVWKQLVYPNNMLHVVVVWGGAYDKIKLSVWIIYIFKPRRAILL